MLQKLTVENYALIDSLELELGPSLNIITGETGAGKSILLGALGLLLGNRSDVSTMKDVNRNCVVEGVFGIGSYDLEPFFEEHDLDYDPNTVIRRVVSPNGKSRAYVNDLPVQIPMLRELVGRLIDIHSQHQSLLIAEDAFRIGVLDSVAGQKELLAEYSDAYHKYKNASRELEKLKESAERDAREEEWLQYQLEQLESAKLTEGEQEELEQQQDELTHAEEIKAALSAATACMDEDETGVLPRLKSIEHDLEKISAYYPNAQEISSRVKSASLELKEMARELAAEAGRIDSDPGKLQVVNERLDLLYSLQQKHKVADLAGLIELQADYRKRLDAITGCSEAIAELEEKIANFAQEAERLASKISKGRQKAATTVKQYVENTLAGLGMPVSTFTAEVTRAGELRSSGGDNVRFMFSANKDMAPQPAEKIASGGEISRLMLALKSLAARSGKLPTIIFDEIDSGVSGRIADAMGNIINSLAENMQVINITHLPQVAAKGDAHFLVYKEDGDKAPKTRIKRLTQDERIDEIAKMLSGSHITDAAIAQARVLLGIIIK